MISAFGVTNNGFAFFDATANYMAVIRNAQILDFY
jgi:hypothetical protein